MKSRHLLPITILALLAALGKGQATLLLYDPFAYSTGDTLGSNNWNLVASSGGVATSVVAQNLSAPGFSPSSGNAVKLLPNGQDWYRTYATQSYESSSNASLYYSFLLRVDNLGSLDTTGGFFGGLASPTGTSGAAMIGLRLSGSGFQIGMAKRDTSALSFDSTVFSVGSTILVVGSYNLVSGSIQNDTASLWINPIDLGQPNAPGASLTASTTGINNDVQSFSSFVWKPQGGAGSTQIPASLIVDEIRVGNSWAEVTPVPEPHTLGMALLGAAGLLHSLRKRRRV